MEERDKKLLEIKNEVLRCRKCSLYKNRKYPVIGQGSHRARIMFIGEAPGRQENLTGHPFCGAAGKILDELLASVSLKRGEIYIGNILKCQPPGNRNPNKEEIEACTPYLLRQIKTIRPKIICSLGNFSTAFIFNQYNLSDKIQGISRIHGQIFEANKTIIIPFYHPAVVAYNANMREILIQDFQVLKDLLSG